MVVKADAGRNREALTDLAFPSEGQVKRTHTAHVCLIGPSSRQIGWTAGRTNKKGALEGALSPRWLSRMKPRTQSAG